MLANFGYFSAIKIKSSSPFRERAQELLSDAALLQSGRTPERVVEFRIDAGWMQIEELQKQGVAIFDFRWGYPDYCVLTIDAARTLMNLIPDDSNEWVNWTGDPRDRRRKRTVIEEFLASCDADEVVLVTIWDQS